MRRILPALLALAAACGGQRNAENSAVCGFAALAAGTVVLDQFQAATTVMPTAPADLAGTVAARVVGRGTARALVARSDSGVTLGYEGEGFPEQSLQVSPPFYWPPHLYCNPPSCGSIPLTTHNGEPRILPGTACLIALPMLLLIQFLFYRKRLL